MGRLVAVSGKGGGGFARRLFLRVRVVPYNLYESCREVADEIDVVGDRFFAKIGDVINMEVGNLGGNTGHVVVQAGDVLFQVGLLPVGCG